MTAPFDRPGRLVIIATNVGSAGGQERALEELALGAREAGVDVHVVAFWASPATLEAASFARVSRPPGPTLVRFLWFWWASAAAYSPQEGDVIVSCGAITARRVDAVWLHMWHADQLRDLGWVTAPTSQVVRFVSRSAARLAALGGETWSLARHFPPRLVAVSDSQRDSLRERYPTAPVSLLRNPVESPRPTPRGDGDVNARPMTVLFLGGSWGHKGLPRIVRATARMASRASAPVRLLVVGPGTSSELKQLHRAEGIQVEHREWTDDPAACFAEADVFALASRHESFSMAGHEALAAGVPVVTTRVHGLADAVEWSGLGRVVDADDDESFAVALEEMLVTARPTDAARKAASEAVRERYGRDALRLQQRQLLADLGLLAPRPAGYGDDGSASVTVTVVIPSVRRPKDLARAIGSVERLDVPPGQARPGIVVVAQEADSPTHDVARAMGVRVVTVDRPGLAWAMHEGARAADTEVVAFIDDDAEVHRDWLLRLVRHYDDPRVGGVGGRDLLVHSPTPAAHQRPVARISPIGQVTGGHHQAAGPARFVDHLKGANCSFRRSALLRTDIQTRVFGAGAQSRNEFALSRAIAAQGLRLVLDPQMRVDHHPSPRARGDERSGRQKIYESAFNEALGFAENHSEKRRRNAVYQCLVGYPGAPGAVRLLTGARPSEWWTTVRGVRDGASAGRAARRVNSGNGRQHDG